jgi:hypothetical protein
MDKLQSGRRLSRPPSLIRSREKFQRDINGNIWTFQVDTQLVRFSTSYDLKDNNRNTRASRVDIQLA